MKRGVLLPEHLVDAERASSPNFFRDATKYPTRAPSPAFPRADTPNFFRDATEYPTEDPGPPLSFYKGEARGSGK